MPMPVLKNKVFLAKGKRSVVYLARLGNKRVVVKEKRADSHAAGRMENEAYWLRHLNKSRIGPKFCYSGKDFVVMDHVPGARIVDWLESHGKADINRVLAEILGQFRELDLLGVNKEEMHHPVKHILVRGKKVTMIDFERCRFVHSPQNVRQFCQFLMSGRVSASLRQKGIAFDRPKIISLLKDYKADDSDRNFKRVLKALSL